MPVAALGVEFGRLAHLSSPFFALVRTCHVVLWLAFFAALLIVLGSFEKAVAVRVLLPDQCLRLPL